MGLAQVGMHPVEFIELASGNSSLAGAPMLLVAGNARERAELVRLMDRPALASRLRRLCGVRAGYVLVRRRRGAVSMSAMVGTKALSRGKVAFDGTVVKP